MLKLMYITNDEQVALIAEKSGIDWIFVDLEIKGKLERQGHLDTVISDHKIEDITKIKSVLTTSELLVRVNPIHENSTAEINEVIQRGADVIMLPYFKTTQEVSEFINIVNSRRKVCLLLETPEAVDNLEDILKIEGIDYIHIGLNDLHLGYKKKFMFELLSDGTVETIIDKISKYNIIYGFGGIARLGEGELPAEKIITEHYRLKSSMVILSRSFAKINSPIDYEELNTRFSMGVKNIRRKEIELNSKSKDFFLENKIDVQQIVNRIVINIGER
jgi:2-keto-3-deoxy-L-rhamnonate aldolase RhmA